MARGRKKGTIFENGYNKNADTFIFLMYLDSAKDNWIDFLYSHFDFVSISPLHDKDLNDNGEPKKPHYHVVVKVNHKLKADYFKAYISENIGGVFPPIQSQFIVSDLKQVIRYQAHLDEFDKPKYPITEFKYKGFDLNAYLNDNLDLKNYCSIEILHLLYSNAPLTFMEWVSDIVKLGNDYVTCFFGRQQTFSNAWRDYEKNYLLKVKKENC